LWRQPTFRWVARRRFSLELPVGARRKLHCFFGLKFFFKPCQQSA
jgi:hypothetical protein